MAQHPGLYAPIVRDAMAYVLAGGRGSRLLELTDVRAKPAVYFGGKSRIIDFALSNALNSGIRRIGVATQYKAHSLIRHLQRGWNFFRPERNEGFDILPASQRSGGNWYAGTADALYQNIDIIEGYNPEYIVVLAGDHIYKMDYAPMLVQHAEQGADVTVGCIEVPRDGGDRLRRHARRCRRPHHRLHREARRSARHARQPGHGPRQHGHLRLQHPVPDRAAAPRRRRPRLQPRFRQGHHPVPGQARQSRRPPLHQLLRHLGRRARGLLARRRHAGCLLGSQYRPDRRSSRRSICTTATGRSGPMPKSPRRPSSCTRRSAAAARRFPRWFPAAASSPARSSASRCCSPACMSIPIRASRMR